MTVLETQELKNITDRGHPGQGSGRGGPRVENGEFVAIVGTSGAGNPPCSTSWAG